MAEARNVVVDDVRTLDNYLACSVGTRSEIVVLIRDEGEVVGQFDVDSDDIGAFGPADETLLERLAAAGRPPLPPLGPSRSRCRPGSRPARPADRLPGPARR